jgi:outer membrane protein OmpA-like peptidoglycan-associated protein
MYKLLLFLFTTLNLGILAQSNSIIHTKSFYYDVDNFSLTSESMQVLAKFVEEIKINPIEIIEIVGYVEKTGSPTYNQIRSKKRMSSIKTAIDTTMAIRQYNPTNINYPPAFLYSYEDGYNWRRVDIIYRILPEKLNLPIVNNLTNSASNSSDNNISEALHANSSINNTTTNNNTVNNTTNNSSESVSNSNNTTNSTIANNSANNTTNSSSETGSNLNNTTNNTTAKNSANNTANNSNETGSNATNSVNNSVNSTGTKSDSLAVKNSVNPDAARIEELKKINENIVDLDPTQKDLNRVFKPEETGKILITGKSQDQIDHLVIREKSSSTNGNKKTYHPNITTRLSKVDVSSMDNSVVLINLNLQFEGDAPIVNSSSVREIDELVKFLKKNNAIDAFIRGHVCCGDEMPLSTKRAKTVYNELIRRGIDPSRLRYEGFSNRILAVDPEKTDVDRAKNRRVDLIFSKNTTRSNDAPPAALVESDKDNITNIFIGEEDIKLELTPEGKAEFSSQGVSQEQLDKILIRDKSTTKKKTKKEPVIDMGAKLSKIVVENLSKSVSLVIMSLEFDDIDPILNDIALKEMSDLFAFLNQNKQVNAFIRGHVCCGDNLKLSKKRAKYVYEELVKRGIDKERLRYQGFSNTLMLVSPERNDLDRAKNRRVDIIFSVKP